jgi:hypothetical protein
MKINDIIAVGIQPAIIGYRQSGNELMRAPSGDF